MDQIIPLEKIENRIYLIRGQKVMIDSDLAFLYGVETKKLNQQVKRNKKRFPDDFMFQVTRYEAEYLEREGVYFGGEDYLKSQIVTSNKANIKTKNLLKSQIVTSSWGGRRGLPYAFTEQGVAMLSSILKTDKAIEMNILIVRAFVKIRQLIYSYKDLADKITKMEREYGGNISKIFKALDALAGEVENKVDKKSDDGRVEEIGFKVE